MAELVDYLTDPSKDPMSIDDSDYGDIMDAIQARKRARDLQLSIANSRQSDWGTILSDLATGVGTAMAGGNGAQAVAKNQDRRDKQNALRFKALDDQGELKGLEAIAKMRQDREMLPQKILLAGRVQQNLADMNNRAKADEGAANRQSKESIAGDKNDTSLSLGDLNNQTRQAMADLKAEIDRLRDETTRRGQDLGKGKADADRSSKEKIAGSNNQTKKDVAGINAKAKATTPGASADRNLLRASGMYHTEMGNTEDQLLAANRVNALVQGITAGDLKGTSQLKSDLSGALASMLNQGKPATVYGMSHQEFDSAYGRAQKALGFLTGETNDTITQPQLEQLAKDVDALKNEYSIQHTAKFNAFNSGLPDGIKPKMLERYNTFRQGVLSAPPKGASSASGQQKPNFTRDQAIQELRRRRLHP
jgi:hypothetical protein